MALALDTPLPPTVFRNSVKAEQPYGLTIPLKEHQLAMLNRCMDIEKQAIMSSYRVGFMADHVSAGKCLGKGTEVLMYSGELRKVEDVAVGDLIMGDDSTPRTVLALGRGQDMMYDIRPERGVPYTVNSQHILCLQAPANQSHWDVDGTEMEAREAALALGGDAVSCMTVEDLLKRPVGQQKEFKAYRKGVDFCYTETILHPYILGTGLNKLERIPDAYKINDRQTRLAVLAGLLDSDGHLDGATGYEIAHKEKELAQDIIFLARSLGFVASTTTLDDQRQTINISGPGLHEIPVRIGSKKAPAHKRRNDCLQYGFDVVAKGRGDYYGFQIDGNRRFMLGDFTVTHNTAVALSLACVEKAKYHGSSLNVIVVPQNICEQWQEEIGKFTGTFLKTMNLTEFADMTDLDIKPQSITQYDVVLTIPSYFSFLADFCSRNNITPKRVIIDEADTIASMVSRKIPGTMTWFVSSTIDRLPESTGGMVQVGKCVEGVEDKDTTAPESSALRTQHGWMLKAEETGTYEVPARLLRSGERICRCEPEWVLESFAIPKASIRRVCVSNVIIDVVACLTFAKLLKPKCLEAANARDFRHIAGSVESEFDILPKLIKRLENQRDDADARLRGLRKRMHMEQRIAEEEATLDNNVKGLALVREQAKNFLLCQVTFEQLALPDRSSAPVDRCLMCVDCQAGYSTHPGEACLSCGSHKDLEVRVPGEPAKAMSKADEIVKIVRSLTKDGTKPRIIIFAKYTQSFAEIVRKVKQTGLSVEEADAGTVKAAGSMIRKFRTGELDVLLAQSNLFCSGMNLPEVTDVFFLHAVHAYSTKQIAGRAQRPGRKEPVRIWKLLHDNELSAYPGD